MIYLHKQKGFKKLNIANANFEEPILTNFASFNTLKCSNFSFQIFNFIQDEFYKFKFFIQNN